MTVTDELQTGEHKPAGVGPGERLQAARIQQGLSLEDVASRMHLSVNILEAIEENDFEEINAPIFVKGYLRAYARIVSLDEDEMIQLYLDYYSEEDPPITSTSNMAPELSVADARIKWTTYLVIIVLGALLAAWWWNKEQSQDGTISLEAEAPVTETEMSAQSETAISEIAATSETQPEPVAEPEPPAETEPVEVVESEPEPADEEPVEQPVVEQEPEIEMEAPEQVQSFSDDSGLKLTRLAPSGSDKLLVIVHADTWADIKDGADHQMVFDLLRANQTLELTGEAPFAVFLGNGHGVEIRFNGEEVEVLSRVRDDNTARLRVGG